MSKKSALDTIKLQSFDASDFLSWKIQVQLGMKEREIFYTVQSDFATTEEDVDEYQWKKDEDFCRDYLLNSLNPRLALTYHAYKTAKEIWDRPNAHFQKEEVLSKSLIGEKFFNFRLKANLPVTTQIIELENLRNKLEDDQSKMDDNLFVYLILSKLPPEWHTFKTKMHRRKEKINLDDLKRFIHIEDQNIAGKCAEQVAQPSQAVNFVSRPSKPARKPPVPKTDTPAPLAVKKPSLKRKKGKCHNCGKLGHWSADCRGPKAQKEEAPRQAANMMVDNSDPKSFVAMIGSSHNGSSSQWWLDSEATCHVTNDRRLLSEVRVVRDRVENCNGGETDVTHAGTVKLALSSVGTSKPYSHMTTATEERKLKGTGFRCIHCGWRIRRLFMQYSPGNIRLMKCDNCKAVADPYIECEFMGIVLKAGLMYFILDACRVSLSISNNGAQDSSRSSFFTWTGLKVLLDVLLGNFVFVSVLWIGIRVFLKLNWYIPRYIEILLAVLVSSYFKMFLLVMMVWDFPPAAIFIVDIFVLSSNTVALKALTQLRTSTCFGILSSAHIAKLLAFQWLLH